MPKIWRQGSCNRQYIYISEVGVGETYKNKITHKNIFTTLHNVIYNNNNIQNVVK